MSINHKSYMLSDNLPPNVANLLDASASTAQHARSEIQEAINAMRGDDPFRAHEKYESALRLYAHAHEDAGLACDLLDDMCSNRQTSNGTSNGGDLTLCLIMALGRVQSMLWQQHSDVTRYYNIRAALLGDPLLPTL